MPPLQSEALQASALAATQSLLLKEAGRAQRAAFRLGVRQGRIDTRIRDVFDEQAEAWVAEFEFAAIRSLTGTEAARLEDVIQDGVRRGEHPSRILGDVRSAVDAGEARVRTIARTELNRAGNWARYTSWQRSGVVREKEFVATLDERVRPGHLAAHGERVPLEAPFTRGDAAGLQMPPIAPNCRCAAVPVTRFTGLALPAQAIAQEVPGLRAAEELHTRRLSAAWRSWPGHLERGMGIVGFVRVLNST